MKNSMANFLAIGLTEQCKAKVGILCVPVLLFEKSDLNVKYKGLEVAQ